MQHIFLFAAPGAHQYQNAASNAGLAHRDTFIGRGNAEPAPAFLLERSRTLSVSVAVGIAFHH